MEPIITFAFNIEDDQKTVQPIYMVQEYLPHLRSHNPMGTLKTKDGRKLLGNKEDGYAIQGRPKNIPVTRLP